MKRYHGKVVSAFSLTLALLCIGLPASRLTAGEIVLINGDRLSGDIIERTRDAIVIEHTALGRIDVPIHSIRLVRTDKVLLPRVPDAPEVPVVPPDVDVDESLDPLPDEEIEPEPKREPEPKPKPKPEPAPEPKPEVEWRSQVEIGANATAGTSETMRLRASVRTTRHSPSNIFRYDATYRFGDDRGNRTQNALTTGVFTEWPFHESPWSMFLQGRYDYSEFQSWDHRISSGAGFGYQLFDITKVSSAGVEESVFNMKLRGGVGLRKEFGSLHEEFDPEGIAGFEMGWRINEAMRLEGGSTAFPSLDHLSEYRIISSVDWIIDINWAKGVALKIGAAHEFESRTDPGVSNHDLSVYGTLMINF